MRWPKLAAFAFLASCARGNPAPASGTGPAAPYPSPIVSAPTDAGAAATSASANAVDWGTADMLTLATDRALMQDLEHEGASLGALLEDEPNASNGALLDKPRYASIVQTLATDVAAAAAADPNAGVGMAKSHRLFDLRALKSEKARFELVGVSHRLDRSHARAQTCGEGRFIYRLAYSTQEKGVPITSRLPATIAFTFFLADGGSCAPVARRARIPPGGATAKWILADDGPFGGVAAIKKRFKAVETNFQIVRWPSTVKPDLGGHAEYVLRVFEPSGRALAAAPLENTPDVVRLQKDSTLRGELKTWMRSRLEDIDEGTAILPRDMCATKSVSVSPLGSARRTNRQFRQLLEPSEIAAMGLGLSERKTVASPEALIRRLDDMSCAGCHQSRSVAGFHLLGDDSTPGANAILVPVSPHAMSEKARRQEVLRLVARDQPPPGNPSPERATSDGGYGAHCGLGDPGFAKWTCDAGFECRPIERERGEDGLIGQCLPKSPAAGDPCEPSVVTSSSNAQRDRAKITTTSCGAQAVCDSTDVGFPSGMCATSCAGAGAQGICAGIPILTTFNACLGRNEPFEACIAKNTRPAGVRACDAATPCRDDYICANGADGKRGACMPPYFLFQLRVDGHPTL